MLRLVGSLACVIPGGSGQGFTTAVALNMRSTRAGGGSGKANTSVPRRRRVGLSLHADPCL